MLFAKHAAQEAQLFLRAGTVSGADLLQITAVMLKIMGMSDGLSLSLCVCVCVGGCVSACVFVCVACACKCVITAAMLTPALTTRAHHCLFFSLCSPRRRQACGAVVAHLRAHGEPTAGARRRAERRWRRR